MSWLDDLHASDPAAWEAMHDAGRIPPAVDIDALIEEHRDATGRTLREVAWRYFPPTAKCGHGECVDAHGHSDGCIVMGDE